MSKARAAVTRAKVGLVGTPAGAALERVRWAAGAVRRNYRPELMDLLLEPYRMDVLLTHHVREDDHCFDGGCHVGSVLAQMVKLAPKGHHVAVEPVQHKAAALRRRFPDVTLVEGALGEERGTLTFYDDDSGFASFHPSEDATAPRAREVEVHTIDDLIGEARLDVLKLDIEGAELWALKGARKTVEYNEPMVLIECGRDEVLQPFGYTRAELYDYVSGEFEYSVYSIVDFLYGREPLSFAEFQRMAEYPFRGFNYVCVPTDRVPTRVIGGRERYF